MPPCSPSLSRLWSPGSFRDRETHPSVRRPQNLRRPGETIISGTSESANGAPTRGHWLPQSAMFWRATPKRINRRQRSAFKVSKWPLPTRLRLVRKHSRRWGVKARAHCAVSDPLWAGRPIAQSGSRTKHPKTSRLVFRLPLFHSRITLANRHRFLLYSCKNG